MKKNVRPDNASASHLLWLSLILSVAALSLPLFLSSCGKEPPAAFDSGSFLLTPEDMQGFTVVRSDSASDLIVRESLRICETISSATGEKVELVTDWQRGETALTSDDSSSEQPLELLVGLTSREESEALLLELADGDYYLLRSGGRKILIAATSESLLTDAVDKFLADYVQIRGNLVYIAQEIDYRSESYPFFSIARGGESQCNFVLPKNAGGALTSSVNFLLSRLEEDYGCHFQVIGENELESLHGMIVVGRVNSALCDTILSSLKEDEDGIVKYAGEQLFITGRTDEGVIAALSEFYATLQSSRDTDFSGHPYARFDTELVLTSSWFREDVPYLLGTSKLEEDSVATAETLVTFGGVTETLLQHYTEILQSEGFSVFWRAVGDDKSFIAENALYRLQVNYTFATSKATVYILRKQ